MGNDIFCCYCHSELSEEASVIVIGERSEESFQCSCHSERSEESFRLQCRRGDWLQVDFRPSGEHFHEVFLTGPAELVRKL